MEKDLVQRPEDQVTETGLQDRLQAFDEYNNLGGRKGLREVMGVKWLKVLEVTRGVSVPDDSQGESVLRNFLETLFDSTDTENFRLERAFAKVHMPRKALTIDAMQLYAAQFAAELNDQLPKIEDPSDRVVQELLIGYFYKGLQPDYLREKISHFKKSTIKQVFNVFREYSTPTMVDAANLSFVAARRKKDLPQINAVPRELRSHSSDSLRAAKKAGSIQSVIPPPIPGELPIFDCNNCGGTHKSMNCRSKCRLCKSKGLDDVHDQYLCPLIPNAKELKQNQQPRGVGSSQPSIRSVKTAASKSRRPSASIISAITQDENDFSEEDSEVRDYPVWVDTCASDIYTPRETDLDSNSSRHHSRDMVQLNVEQADGTKLVSSGIGTFAGAPAYVMPAMSETLLGANVVCKLGNLMLVDHEKIICVGSDASTRASLSTFYEFIRQNKNLVKFTAFADNGCYKVLRSKIRPLNSKKYMAKLISRYETVQFSDLYHFVRFWHEAMGHADLRTMLLIANRIVSHPSEFNGFPREFTPRIIRKHFPVTCNSCPLGNLNRRPSVVSTDSPTPREILPGEEMEIDIHGKVSDSTGRPSPSRVLYIGSWLYAAPRVYFGGKPSRLARICSNI